MGKTKPTLGITMGDPMGVGAEILIGALADTSAGILDRADVVIFGLADTLRPAAKRMGVPLDRPGVRIVDFPEHCMPAGATHEPNAACEFIPVLDQPLGACEHGLPGHFSTLCRICHATCQAGNDGLADRRPSL